MMSFIYYIKAILATPTSTESPTQSATESPTESATQRPTESATQLATEVPTKQPTEHITEVITQKPIESEQLPGIIVVNPENTTDDRFDLVINDSSIVQVHINYNGNGGAIHLLNNS